MIKARANFFVATSLSLAMLAVAGASAQPAKPVQEKPSQAKSNLPGMTYESLKDLPDWTGGWGDAGMRAPARPGGPPGGAPPLPYRPEFQARAQEHARLSAKGGDATFRGLGQYCRPPIFTGGMGGPEFYIEYLFTPGRVTITAESGLVRRIYTDGRKLPAAGETTASSSGTSIGHWEGQTLVVETVGFMPTAMIGDAPIGNNAKVTERMILNDRGMLQIDVTTEAPEALTTPYKRTELFERHPGYIMLPYSACQENDRAIDPATGKQRFDMTPPADLPPPPK